MKKTFLIGMAIIVFALSGVYADELLQNPGLEDWTAGEPNDWSLSSGAAIAQEASTVHGGSSSAEITWTSTSTQDFEQVISINSGAEYSYSAWILDNDPAGRARLWIRFRDASGELTGSSLDSPYTEDDAAWQQVSIDATAAPADAVTAEFQVRFYDVSAAWAGSAVVYVDDISMQGSVGDLTPPVDTLIRVIDTDSIEITFNEDLDQATAETAGNYFVDNGVGSPSAATLDGGDAKKVVLDFPSALPTGVVTITIDGVEDGTGNATSGLDAEFFGAVKAPGDVDDVSQPDGEQIYEGVYATVQGLVIAAEFNSDNVTIVGLSDNDGVEARNESGSISGVARGDRIIVAGEVSAYNGYAQVQGAPLYYSIEESGLTTPEPESVPVTAVTNVDEEGANVFAGEAYEGDLVVIGPVTIGNNMGSGRTGGAPDEDGLFDSNANYEIRSGGETGVLRIDGTTELPDTPIPNDAMIIGVIQQYDYSSPYNAFYSIFPRDVSDFEQAAAAMSPWALYE